MTSACVKWGHALGFSGSLGEFDKLSLNFEVKVTSPRSKLPRGALSDNQSIAVPRPSAACRKICAAEGMAKRMRGGGDKPRQTLDKGEG